MTSTAQLKTINNRVGSYAISTIDFNSWMTEPIVQAPIRTRKTRGAKEVVNKIFSECATIIQDSFWIDKFNNAAMGKFPQKFNFNDGILTYRKGAKNHSLEVSNNPYEAAHACMEFLRVNGGIFSPMDEQISLEAQYSRTHAVLTQQKLTWADANKKVQECMLSYYVMDMKVIMTLDGPRVEQLRQTIRLGISNKYFGKTNIRVENNRIHSIDGLLYNNELKIFYINPELKPNTTRTYLRKKTNDAGVDSTQKDTVPQFGVKWVKYVETLDKKIVHSNHRKQRITVNQGGATAYNKHLNLVSTSGTTTAGTGTGTGHDSTTADEEGDSDE